MAIIALVRIRVPARDQPSDLRVFKQLRSRRNALHRPLVDADVGNREISGIASARKNDFAQLGKAERNR